MKKIIVFTAITMLVFSLAACQKKEEPSSAQKSPVPQGPITEIPGGPPGHGISGQKTEFQVVVPPDVTEQWSGVTIIVDDKKENTKQEFTLNIGEEFQIPESGLTVKVGPFLPDFKMSGTVITSSTSEPNNPSVGVAVFEDGKQLFPSSGKWGWLYAKFPTIHSFQHERYSLSLKEAFKKE